jgi:hypothetical protein
MRSFQALLRPLPVLLLTFLHAMSANAQSSPGLLCHKAIAMAELGHRIPDEFLAAIARVESGRPVDGKVVSWPWTINAEGAGSFFATKDDAIAAVQALQARGVKSIDVGCMQVNLQQHPEAFRSLDQAFDPATNAEFAAGLLVSLFNQAGSWPLAAAAYHSQTPTLGAAYQRQVLAAWAEPDRPSAAGAKPPRGPASTAPAVPAPAMQIASNPGRPAFGRQLGVPGVEPQHPQALHSTGRGLDAYRQAPVQMAFRLPVRPG